MADKSVRSAFRHGPGSRLYCRTGLVHDLCNKAPESCVVLEGGGALGLAHIGVLQWMEEHRIPVNYVAGTSMGGLVGGLYATGRSASEVRQVVQTIDWDEVLRGQTPFPDFSHFVASKTLTTIQASLNLDYARACSFPPGSIRVSKCL